MDSDSQMRRTGCMKATAKSLGDYFAGFLGWDKLEERRYNSCFRIRAWVRVDLPLRRG